MDLDKKFQKALTLFLWLWYNKYKEIRYESK